MSNVNLNVYGIEECPNCGSDEYYVREKYYGRCNVYMKLNGEDADNSEMYDNAMHSYTSNFAFCSECDEKLFKIPFDEIGE